MKPNIFDVFKEINTEDAENKTANLVVSPYLVSVYKVKGGYHCTMGVDEATGNKMCFNPDSSVAILLIVDRATYEAKTK